MDKDPVCGMQVNPSQAAERSYRGKMYYFCSLGCAAKFDQGPQRYVAPDPPQKGGTSGTVA